MRLTLAPLVLAWLVVPVADAQDVGGEYIIQQDSQPVLIKEFDADSRKNRITYDVEAENIELTQVVAVQYGVLSFGPFGTLLAALTWTEIDEIKPASRGGLKTSSSFYWRTTQARKHFDSVIYVRGARLKDGRIWQANSDSIRKKVRQKVRTPTLRLPDDTSSALPEKGLGPKTN